MLTIPTPIHQLLARLDYTVDARETVYLSIEEGGQPVGSLADVTELAQELGYLDQHTTHSLGRLDRALYQRATQPLAA